MTRYNGRPMSRFSTLRAAIAVTPPGTKSTFEILRDGKSTSVNVQIADWTANEAQSLGGIYSNVFGGIVRTLDPEIRRMLGRGFGNMQGVIVQKLDPAGPASSDFEEGDVIVAIDEQPVRTAEEFRAILDKADLKRGVRMSVIRNRMRGAIDFPAK